MQPTRVGPNYDRNGKQRPGWLYEFDLPRSGSSPGRTVKIRDDAGGDWYGPGDPQNRGPHFNDEAGGHYDY
jgi:filamentous hemagglutinin